MTVNLKAWENANDVLSPERALADSIIRSTQYLFKRGFKILLDLGPRAEFTTRDPVQAPCIGSTVLAPGPPGKFPHPVFSLPLWIGKLGITSLPTRSLDLCMFKMGPPCPSCKAVEHVVCSWKRFAAFICPFWPAAPFMEDI